MCLGLSGTLFEPPCDGVFVSFMSFFYTTVDDLFEILFHFLPVSEEAVIKVPNVCIFGWIIILGCLSGLFKPLQSLV